jgi:hypothetical protein
VARVLSIEGRAQNLIGPLESFSIDQYGSCLMLQLRKRRIFGHTFAPFWRRNDILTDQLTSRASDLRFVTRSSMMYYYPMVATCWWECRLSIYAV